MPLRGKNSDVVRLVRGDRGEVAMRMQLILRFGYGAVVPWVTRLRHGDTTALCAVAGPDRVALYTPVQTRGEELTTVAEFTVSAGETIPFTLIYGPSHEPPPEPVDPLDALAETEAFWIDWSARCSRALPGAGEKEFLWSEAVMRSLITLKALTHTPTGPPLRSSP